MEAIFSSQYSMTQHLIGWIAALWGIYISKMMYDYCVQRKKLIEAAKKFPGPPTLPLLGNCWEFIKDLEKTFEAIINIVGKYPVCRLWLGPRLLIAITNPKEIEIVMKSQETAKKSFGHDFMAPLVVNGLINGYGPKMRAHRKLLVPMINGEHLINYMETFKSQIRRCVDRLMIKMNKTEFDIFEEAEYCVADMAFETILGIPGIAQSDGDLTIPHSTEIYLETLKHRIMTPWLHPSFLFNLSKHGRASNTAITTIHKFIQKVIEDKKKLHTALARHEPGVDKPKPSILDLLMENVIETNAMDDREILYDIITIFIGFNDTILGVYAFAMMMLAMHPNEQDKVREEVMSVIGTGDDFTAEHIGKLNYTKMVIKETVRLFAVGPLLIREVIDDLDIGDYTLPKGSSVAVIAAVTHKSKEYWDEPDKFIPERFSPENSKDRHQFAFVPFSGGSRRCPGTKFGMTCLKVMIAQFVRKCRLTTKMTLQTLKLNTHISVRSRVGYRLTIEKIE